MSLAGDWYHKSWVGGGGSFTLIGQKDGISKRETIESTEIEYLSLASEENIKRLGGTVGWGAAGGLILGPVGLLAGLLLGGKSKEVTFLVKFKDGRKLIATTDPKTWTAIQAGGIHAL